MSVKADLLLREALPEDRHQIANLIHFELTVHRHLDWRGPLEWIGHQPFLVVQRGKRILAALACPPDPPDTAWIRLFAVSSGFEERDAWEALWQEAKTRLEKIKPTAIAAIPTHKWFQRLLESSGFVLHNRVTMLFWENVIPHPLDDLQKGAIRPMSPDDLQIVTDIDTAAFKPIWRNSKTSLQIAYRQATIATVIEVDNKVAGYQISTANHMGGHLARLAIHPDWQGVGLGYALLRDLLVQFQRKGVHRVTVNTQIDNAASIALYKKAGFLTSKEDIPVYQYLLK